MPSETPSSITLPVSFLSSYTAAGDRLTGNDIAIWLTVLASAPSLVTDRWTAEASVSDAAATGSLSYTSIDVPRPHFYDQTGRLSLPRFHSAVDRLKSSTFQVHATRCDDFIGPVQMLGDYRTHDTAAVGANAVEVFQVHPFLATWTGKGTDTVATLDRSDLAKLTSRYSVMLYSRWRAAKAAGWGADIHAEALSKAGYRIRVPADVASSFFGYELIYASQAKQRVFDIVAAEFEKIEILAEFEVVKASGRVVAIQVILAPWTVDRGLRELGMRQHAKKIDIGVAKALKAMKTTHKRTKKKVA